LADSRSTFSPPAWAPVEERAMNSDVLKGKWLQMRGDIRHKWAELTDDDLDQIDGDLEKLAGKLQEKYGYAREEARQQVDDFFAGWQV
jgi:uncharacterized protein YjbJ (UPF0337 family)